MPVPVLVGVGHETDRSVVDDVAHTSCKTPTACAQVLIHQVRAFVTALDDAARRVAHHARACGALAGRELDDATRRLRRDAPAAVFRADARVGAAHARAEELVRRHTREAGVALREREVAVATRARHHLERATLRLDAVAATTRALDPRRVLERGYTITRTADGRVVRAVADAPAGAQVVTELARGRITSTVDDTVEEPE
jgi:exodeoxyribonuclease VII large subunit